MPGINHVRLLYPDIVPRREFHLEVDPPHVLYVEESGNPHGIPVLFVHGGPGAGCAAFNRRFFDPDLYRIILFDQRGAGRSEPHAELRDNHTAALVEDMEKIRQELGIERWMLFGGSWGSTLSLVYAQAHPERVLGMVLRGVFLCRRQDIDWFYQYGASQIFPEYWEDFVAPIPAGRRHQMVDAYYELLTGDNDLARMSAAKAWSVWEGRTATLRPNEGLEQHFSEPHLALSLARIEAHYFRNNAFLEENQILEQAGTLQGIPGVIVHGRYDMICPAENAFALHQAWPEAELQIIRDCGHSATEPGLVDALVRATATMARLLDPSA